MANEAVTVPELMELLDTSIRCAEAAFVNLRFDFGNRQHRAAVGLLCVVVEHANAIHNLTLSHFGYSQRVLHRALIDAFVDIMLVCKDRKYCESLELDDALSWRRLLEEARKRTNPYLKDIADAPHFEMQRIGYANKVRELTANGVKKLNTKERYKHADMPHEYDAVHGVLSAEAHNNGSWVANHYFDAASSPIAVRPKGPKPGMVEPRATLLNVPEVVIAATENVLRLCGHGVAVMAPANRLFYRIYGKITAPNAV